MVPWHLLAPVDICGEEAGLMLRAMIKRLRAREGQDLSLLCTGGETEAPTRPRVRSGSRHEVS